MLCSTTAWSLEHELQVLRYCPNETVNIMVDQEVSCVFLFHGLTFGIAGKTVMEPFTGIGFEQEKKIDNTDYHLHATAVRCMLGQVSPAVFHPSRTP